MKFYLFASSIILLLHLMLFPFPLCLLLILEFILEIHCIWLLYSPWLLPFFLYLIKALIIIPLNVLLFVSWLVLHVTYFKCRDISHWDFSLQSWWLSDGCFISEKAHSPQCLLLPGSHHPKGGRDMPYIMMSSGCGEYILFLGITYCRSNTSLISVLGH